MEKATGRGRRGAHTPGGFQINFPPLRYRCVHCSFSCAHFEVQVQPAEVQRLEQATGRRVALRVLEEPRRMWLARGHHSCQFFSDSPEGGCTVHADKPSPCADFPFRIRRTPAGDFVGASFACTAIAFGEGPPVDEAMVQKVSIYELKPPDVGWEVYERWEKRVMDRLRELGPVGLWRAAMETAAEVAGGFQPGPHMEPEMERLFRGVMAFLEGPLEPEPMMRLLEALAHKGTYPSKLLGRDLDVAEVMSRWEEPWPLWFQAQPFFEHLIFRKYLLEGPDVLSRICTLPILAQAVQFLATAREGDVRWAIRELECRLTFHARGIGEFIGRFGPAFLRSIKN